jgi:hypothetical protein
MAFAPPAGWANFYVVTGTSAAALTGLTFVVIALIAGASRVNPHGLRAFVTPTIVHFGTVLGLAAFMCVPRQTLLSAVLGIGGTGMAGLIYVGIIASRIRHSLGDYLPVGEDWIWNVILPSIAYGGLLAMAVVIWRRSDPELYGVAGASMLLLFIGIHNAWDIAVWMTLSGKDLSARDDSNKENERASGAASMPREPS